MKIAVLSGKGGTGKTLVSVNLAYIQKNAAYIDCDVEVPNGHLFLKPEQARHEDVYVPVPKINHSLCDGCRACVAFCRYTALAYAGGNVMVFPEQCHSCGGCRLVCPHKAIQEEKRLIGSITTGLCNSTTVISGSLLPGEITGFPIIRKMMEETKRIRHVVIDCPPGCSCQVIQSILDADVCIIVAEPSLFGMHDMQMIYALLRLYNKPFGIVINKSLDVRNYVKTFCRENKVKVLAEIPFSPELAQLNARGELAAARPEYKKVFQKILRNAEAVLAPRKEFVGTSILG